MQERINAIIDVILPSLVAIVAALLIGAVMLLLLGANPIKGYAALLEGAFGNTNALADTVVKATPLRQVSVTGPWLLSGPKSLLLLWASLDGSSTLSL